MGRGRQFDEKAYFGFDDFRVFEVTSSPSPSGLEGWEIALIVIFTILGVALLVAGVFFVMIRYRRKNDDLFVVPPLNSIDLEEF